MRKRKVSLGLLVAVLILTLPNLLYPQYVELYNDNGTQSGSATFPTQGFIWAEKFHPTWPKFKIDSVKFAVYRYSGSAATLLYRIHLYEDNLNVASNGCPGGAVTCGGPGPQRWADATDRSLAAPGTVGQWVWRTVNVPDCTFTGDFIVGIEIRNTANEPSLGTDSRNHIPCCDNFYYAWTLDPPLSWNWYEHYDFPPWSYPDHWEPICTGYNMIRAKGWNQGTAPPATLELSTDSIEFGKVDISYDGGTEYVNESLGFTNTGGTALTITSVVTDDPLHFIYNALEVMGPLNPGQTKWLHIDFSTWEPTLATGDLIVTHTAGSEVTCRMSGQGFGGHWLENFTPYPEPYPGPAESGDWHVRQNQCPDKPWEIYTGFGYANASFGHWYPDAGCYAEDLLYTSPINNPDGSGIRVSWKNYNCCNSDYDFHGLYWSDANALVFNFVAEIPPTTQGEWVEVGPYYINTEDNSIRLGFLYKGEYADNWFIDDIQVDSLLPMPPILTHEHHSDDGPASWIDPGCIHITCQVLDPNNDPLTVTLWYRDHETPAWSSVAMTAVTGCEHLYEALMCDLEICSRYDYYFYAIDNTGLDSTLPATAPTDYFTVDIMDNTKPQMAYDSGVASFVHYFSDWWGRHAVRFTPPFYPYSLGGAMVMVGNSEPDNDHEDIVVEVYDDNGVGGLPGVMLNYPEACGTSWNPGAPDCDDTDYASWVYVKIEPCVMIMDGDFYIAVRNRDDSVAPDMEAFGYDDDGPSTPYRTYCFYPEEGGSGYWGLDILNNADLMLRAIECACVPAAPTNVTVYRDLWDSTWTDVADTVIIRWTHFGDNLSYNIYRSTTNPFSGFALLGTVTATAGVDSFIDPVGANTKAFYYVTGSCDPPEAAAAAAPPSERQKLKQ